MLVDSLPFPHNALTLFLLQNLTCDTATTYEVYAASGRFIYRLTPPRPATGPAGRSGGCAGERGKGGEFIFAPGAGVTARLLEGVPQRAEIQDLRLWEAEPGSSGGGAAILASVDCYGRAVLAHLRRVDGGGDSAGGGGEDEGEGDGSGSSCYQPAALHLLQPTDLLR